MGEPRGTELGHKIEVYKDPDYTTLYRYENPSIPYDKTREGKVSKEAIIGNWFTDSLKDLKVYTRTRIRGQRGGRFVVVRVPKVDLDKYDATKLPETRYMDIEPGNYIIPPEIGKDTRVEAEGIFKDNWEGKENVPFADWKAINEYIDANLSDEAIIAKLTR